MKDTFYLVFDKRGVRRINKKYLPSLDSGEYMVRVHVEIPQQFFERSIPTAVLMIPEDYIGEAPPIEVTLYPLDPTIGAMPVE